MNLVSALWGYRGFVLSAIRNEFAARFSQSKLGALWMIIHPLMQVSIFALILSEVLAAKIPGVGAKYGYALYLMAGTAVWALFSETVVRFTSLFVDNGNLMKKVAFPRICLPFVLSGTLLINNALLIVAIFVVFALLGHVPSFNSLWIVILALFTLALGMSIGLILGVLNVFVRDVGQVVPVVMQALFWLTPIVYSLDILPSKVRAIFELNPIYPLVSAYHNILLYGVAPDWLALLPLFAVTVLLSFMSLVIFRRASQEILDVL